MTKRRTLEGGRLWLLVGGAGFASVLLWYAPVLDAELQFGVWHFVLLVFLAAAAVGAVAWVFVGSVVLLLLAVTRQLRWQSAMYCYLPIAALLGGLLARGMGEWATQGLPFGSFEQPFTSLAWKDEQAVDGRFSPRQQMLGGVVAFLDTKPRSDELQHVLGPGFEGGPGQIYYRTGRNRICCSTDGELLILTLDMEGRVSDWRIL